MSINMFSQRAVQTSMRRLTAANASSRSLQIASPSAVALGRVRYAASAATTIVTPEQGNEILASQRRHRPVSPHLTIYKPQIPWILSALNRVTGSILSGGFYIFGFGYLVAPYVGLHWESASIAASFAALPIVVKVATKMLLAFPFTFHSINGIRHLVWDTGAAITNKQVIVSGWFTVALTTATALGLTFY